MKRIVVYGLIAVMVLMGALGAAGKGDASPKQVRWTCLNCGDDYYYPRRPDNYGGLCKQEFSYQHKWVRS